MADAGLDHEVAAEVAGDRLRLGGRLDDDELLSSASRDTLAHRDTRTLHWPPSPVRAPLYAVIAAAQLADPARSLFRLRARGIEHLPAGGGFVLAANHISNFDPWPLGIPLFPRPVPALHGQGGALLAAARLDRSRRRRLPRAARRAGHGGDRDGRATSAARGTSWSCSRRGRAALKGLRKTHEARAHTGAARIALEAGVPLVPAGISGTDRLARLAALRVAYGPPVADRRPPRPGCPARPHRRRPTG